MTKTALLLTAVLVVLILASCGSEDTAVGQGNTTDQSEDPTAATTEVNDAEPAPDKDTVGTPLVIDQSATVIQDRCSFEPGSEWTELPAAPLGELIRYSAVPEEPITFDPQPGLDPGLLTFEPMEGDTPGLYVSVLCQTNQDRMSRQELDELRRRLPDLGTVSVVEESDGEMSGQPAYFSVFNFSDSKTPQSLHNLGIGIDVGNSRCEVRAVGDADRVAEARPEIEVLIESLVCVSSPGSG